MGKYFVRELSPSVSYKSKLALCEKRCIAKSVVRKLETPNGETFSSVPPVELEL